MRIAFLEHNARTIAKTVISQRKRAETQALLAQLKSDCAANGVALPKTPGGTVRTPTGKPQQRKRKAEPVAPTRRSTRVSKKAVEFRKLESDDEDDDGEPIVREKKFVKKSDDQLLPDEKIPHRTPRVDGRIFGPIDGVEVGAWWQYRDDCGRAGVHAPTVAGIFGGEESGAYSVAVSAGYPEDLDLGDTFTYTGSGGRELKKKNLRTAPQSSDQVLTRGNAALDKSARTGNPIRVIRGHKAAMGPLTGYR